MKQVKKQFELNIVNLIKKGYNPSKIAVNLNISLPNLSYYLSSLKQQGIIKKIGYGVWEVTPEGEVKILSYVTNTQVKDIRGHAFIWKVRINRLIDWKVLLNKYQINYDELGIHRTPRIILNSKKIWLGQKNIIVYEKDSYFASNSINSKKEAIYSLLQTIRLIEQSLNINLNNFKFTCAKEHYSLIQNDLAKQCDLEGKSILIKNLDGYWMTIDNSYNLHEAEAVGKDAMLNIEGIKRYFNSHNETKFKVTPEFILNTMNGIQQNQSMFAQNIESHIKAIQDISLAVNELTKQVKRLNENK